MNDLRWKKYPVLNDGFICLVDHMGDDSRIVQAERVSYGMDERETEYEIYRKALSDYFKKEVSSYENTDKAIVIRFENQFVQNLVLDYELQREQVADLPDINFRKKDRGLIRRLMMDGHTSPFEKVKFEFLVRVPMDCWRQWIRHRTADVNEYSTRYKEAIDSQQTTHPGEWRLQSQNNKQGSSGFLEEWPEGFDIHENGIEISIGERINGHGISYLLPFDWWEELGYLSDPNEGGEITPGQFLTWLEKKENTDTTDQYQLRLALGIAREQARKDLPLSTYTEAYWGCNLHNIFNFLRLRMDSDAQLEIRSYANAMYEIIKQVCPIACEAFEDYVLYAKRFSRMEMEVIREFLVPLKENLVTNRDYDRKMSKPDTMTDNEWKSFLEKLT